MHGPIHCRKCFGGEGAVAEIGIWRIRNDPGSWGSPAPKYVVLGFSKGATQANIYEGGAFDSVAFGGVQTRANLTRILQIVGLLGPKGKVDDKIQEAEQEFHFGSLVRCSLARRERDGGYKTSGRLITRSFREIPLIINNCAEEFLAEMPESVRLVLMLGTDGRYIKEVKKMLQRIHPTTFADKGPIAFKAGQATWVHLTHPSRSNVHLAAWLQGDESSASGRKQKMAAEIIASALCGE